MACRVLYDLRRKPAILVLTMKHRPRSEEQDDLLRPRLVNMIDERHESVKLAALIDCVVFEREWGEFFPSHKGRPATEPRLVAGLLYLKHAYRLSDEAVVARWVKNPTINTSPGRRSSSIVRRLTRRNRPGGGGASARKVWSGC